MHARLRDASVHTWVKPVESPRMGKQRALFVLGEPQFDDAVALMRDASHRASGPVDAAAFEHAFEHGKRPSLVVPAAVCLMAGLPAAALVAWWLGQSPASRRRV